MSSILVESLIIVGLLLINGVFAMSEIAVVTSRRARLERRVAEGSAGATHALRLVDDPTRFLSTVQIGITLIGVLAGAFGGATIAAQLDARLELIPRLAPFSEVIAVGVVVGAISFASLVLGELVPKRVALQSPERIAAIVAGPMLALARVASPLVTLLTWCTTGILRMLGVSEAPGTRVTQDEIRSMIAEGRQSGAVAVVEQEMLEGVFRLGDRRIRDVMVPRHVADWVDTSEGTAAVAARLTVRGAGDVVLCRGSLDEVIGIVRPSRFLAASLAGTAGDIETLAEEPLFMPGSVEVLRLVERFRASGERTAVVLDEFGGVEGVVTLDEVLAEIVGDAPSLGGEPESTRRDDGSWLLDGDTEFAEVALRFALPPIPEHEIGSYRTLAGFVFARAGHIPRVGERVTWGGVTFEVMDLDDRRVDKVLVMPRGEA